MDRSAGPVSLVFLAQALGAASSLWGLWCVVIAFVGGTLPIPGLDIEVDGGIFTGLLFLFIGVPMLMTVAYWVSMVVFLLVSMPFIAADARRRKAEDEEIGDVVA